MAGASPAWREGLSHGGRASRPPSIRKYVSIPALRILSLESKWIKRTTKAINENTNHQSMATPYQSFAKSVKIKRKGSRREPCHSVLCKKFSQPHAKPEIG